MTVQIFERVDSRKLNLSFEAPTADFEYLVLKTFNDNEVRAAVQSEIGAYYRTTEGIILPFSNYTIEHQGNGIWFVVAHYSIRQRRGAGAAPALSGSGAGTGPAGGGSPLQQPGGPSGGRNSSFNFEIGSENVKLTQSESTVRSYNLSLVDDAPDLKGAIGWDGETLQGVEIQKPVLTFSETHYFPAAFIDEAYVVGLLELANKPVNTAAFRGFQPGEVRYLGGSGSLKDESTWEVTYKFAVQKNRTDIQVGAISALIEKKGWEYLWVRYAPTTDENVYVPQPASVYIEKIYFSSSFDVLGIGA